jgi:hypothetical protein
VTATPGQAAPELPKVPGHPDDAAEEYLAETFEPSPPNESPGYEREHMIDAYHAGWDKAREQVAKFGKDENGRWRTLETQPAPELAEVAAKLAEVAAERDRLRAAPEQRELDGLREKLEAAEQEAADVRACAVGTFALIAVLARGNPAAQRQANELREQIGMLPSPPEADLGDVEPAPELIRAMGVIAAYEDYARRMTIPDATARAALRERHGVEPAPELAAAMRETKAVLGLIDDFTHAVIDLDDGARLVSISRLAAAARGTRTKAGLPPVEGK